MSTYMEELVAAWIGNRRRSAQQEAVIELIREMDTRFHNDEDLRQSTLKHLQRDFYRVAIAEKLSEKPELSSAPHKKLLELADEILDKSHNRPGLRGRSGEVRTLEEQRCHDTVRVRWSKLLKQAGVKAADNRGGDTSRVGFRALRRGLN